MGNILSCELTDSVSNTVEIKQDDKIKKRKNKHSKTLRKTPKQRYIPEDIPQQNEDYMSDNFDSNMEYDDEIILPPTYIKNKHDTKDDSNNKRKKTQKYNK